jgi:hypothetical protein
MLLRALVTGFRRQTQQRRGHRHGTQNNSTHGFLPEKKAAACFVAEQKIAVRDFPDDGDCDDYAFRTGYRSQVIQKKCVIQT